LLAAVALLSVVPRVLDGAVRPIEFNGFWHVFIARNLSREWRALAHPPLYLILLKAVQAFGHAPLVYRSIGIASGAASVYLVGRILEKLRVRPEVGLLGAAAMALAGNPMSLSLTIESYALSVAFLLGSFFFYLDFVGDAPPPLRSRISFAVLAALALLTHYFAGLYLGACVAAPFLAAAILPAWRQAFRRSFPSRAKAGAWTLLPLAGLGLLLYELMARSWVGSSKGLPAFYFDRRFETLAHFLVRNLGNTFGLLSPIASPRARYAIAGLVVFFALAISLAASGKPEDPRRLLPALFSLLLLLAGAVLGSLRLYPFGGALRHQFLIYVFALLAAFIALDGLLGLLRGRPARVATLAAAAGAVAFAFAVRMPARDPREPESFLPKLAAFERQFPDARVVHVDLFNLIGVFSGYHDADWRFEGTAPGDSRVERYAVEGRGKRFEVVAHRNWWFFWFSNRDVYRDLALSWPNAACQTIFGALRRTSVAAQPRFVELPPEGRRARIEELSAAEGLEARRVVFDDLDVFAELCAEDVLRVSEIVPAGTRAGAAFQAQPSGESAMSIHGAGFRPGAVVSLGGTRLPATYGNRAWLTVIVPGALYARPGTLALRIENPDGSVSNSVTFEVRP
jgi:hypothetical protein